MNRPHAYKYKFVCHICSYGTYDARNLKGHIFKHTGAKPLKCPKCFFTSSYERNLRSHLRRKHNHFTYSYLYVTSKFKTIPFVLRNAFVQLCSQFPDNSHACTHCGQFQSVDINAIVEHCRTCKYMSRPHSYKYKYVCHLCSYGSYDIRNIKAHIFNHWGEKPYKCSHCLYSSSYLSHVRSHMRYKHTG
ncbi:zinc finger protein 64 homolog, isoforms 3 and 4-like [Diaphorina citri]|uniref:Zinc finger protein 64 homolog, isoforms 3 and 4-like n=1 Tax=Diaphorina citri TaxID=121845 RepID=A0A3Q0IL18_DIACI|nr:zinc finger protein 64 homolog, isoforms 3 and 4-like [Diaphorina citri]